MHTARLPTVRVSVATTRCQYWWRVGPQVNKFEWVSKDDHQMSVVGRESDVQDGGGYPYDLSHDVCDVPTPTSSSGHND